MSKGFVAVILICLGVVVSGIVLKPVLYLFNSSTEVPNPPQINPLLKRAPSEPLVEPLVTPIKVSNVDPIVVDVKRIIRADNSFTKKDLKSTEFQELYSQYKTSSHLNLPDNLKEWQGSYYTFNELCNYGYQLLQTYENMDHEDETYEAITATLIKQIGDALKDYKRDDTKALGITASWVYSMTYLARFLIAYEYIGTDENIKHDICHSLLTKFVPKINKAAGVEINPNNPLSLHCGMIRLLTNYLYDKISYHNDINEINKLKTISSLNIPINNSDEIKDGVYRDSSCIRKPNIASYYYLTSFYLYPNYNFYESTCKVIGLNIGNLPTSIEKVFSRIFHPEINYVPFGLFDVNGSIQKPQYLNIQGLTGVFIFPLIGLGVFKNHEMMFSIRVQRPNIAACMIDDEKSGHYILGSIQLRRIYQINGNYPMKLNWNQLSNEPGIITVVDRGNPTFYTDQLIITDNRYSCSDIDENNLIGRLPGNENVMFWFNKYKCNLIQCSITEVGLMTDNGLEISFLIHNHGSADVQLRVKDETPSTLERQLHYISNPPNSQGFVVIPAAQAHRISWSVVFNPRINSNLTYNVRLKTIRFNYASQLYTVIFKENSQYIVEVGNDKNVFGGSSSSNPDDTMTLDRYKPMKRNPETLMYS